MKDLPAIFQNGEQVYAIDTCEPLKAAVLRDEVQLHAWGHALYPGILLPRTFLPAVRSVVVWDAPTRQTWGLDLPQHAASDWNLAAMASQCGLSRSQFSDYCKQLIGLTPMQYLTRCRIDLAMKLLAERPDLSITDVAYHCGFNSSQYFATVFRAAKACSPRAFVAQRQATVRA